MAGYFPESVAKPLFVLFLITALVISPLLFIRSPKVIAANAHPTETAPVSAPPEPFILPSHSVLSAIESSSLFAAFTSLFRRKTKASTTTFSPPPPGETNYALASNGGMASASTQDPSYTASGTIDGDRKGLNWGSNGGWNDATSSTYPDWLEVDFNGSKSIDEIDVFTVQDNYSNPSDPTETMTFSSYGIIDFDIQYWNGSSWVTVSGGSITNNNKVWNKVQFSAVTTSKIRAVVNNALASYSRITEVEAWGTSGTTQTNVALAPNGGAASASSQDPSFAASGTIDGDRKGTNWGSNGGWNDATAGTYPDWLEVDFNGSKSIDEVDVFTVQDNYSSPSEPTENMTFSSYGITDFNIQYWDGSSWITVPGGSVTGNNKVWTKVQFSPLTTTKIRVVVNNALASYSRITEVEAWTGSGSSSDPNADLGKARLSPKNANGSTDLYSQNFAWGTGLVSLPGRAGLDLGLGISYNSLVWTKDSVSNSMVFDPDTSNVSPGFRIGYPTIEQSYYDSDKSKNVYLMVTPSGARVEFRQVTGTTDTFETADSSYAQLKVTGTGAPENLTLTVTGTDGTQTSYVWNTGAYRCTQIKDRNGNYISIAYDTSGKLQTVTDTLGRVITVNYTSGLPSSITQTWKDTNGAGSNVTHTWATLSYTTTDGGTGHAPAINTNFGSLTVAGPANNTALNVLQKITYADGSYTQFSYNNYAQVVKVQNFAANNDELNHARLYDIETVSGVQSDCPRFTVTKSYAENFNGGNEITVTNTYNAVSNYSIYSGQTISGTRIDTVMTGEPDNLYNRSFYASSGWQEGLPLATEDCIGTPSDGCSTRKRWTWQSYTQDDTGLSYVLNPRVTETRVGDGTNTKRTTIDYRYDSGTSSYLYGLPETVKVYDTDLSTVLKTQTTSYNLDSNYTSRRIIGLPAETDLYQGTSSGTLMSKVTYAYDENGYTGTGQSVSPTQHDDTNFGTSLTYRGNPTRTSRWDVTNPTNSSLKVTSSIAYNTAGLPVSQTDPRSRTVAISYADSWNDSVSRSTYAYPTTLTDPNGNSSTVIYRYDIGTNIEANSPAPAGNTYGKKTKRIFDSVGRLERNSVYINTTEYSYVRYAFPTNGVQSQTYSTVTDTNNNGYGDSADEVLTETWTDGAGHVRLARTPHTFNTDGTTATWAGTETEYDILGRVSRQSVPTEIDSSWNPTGDDATRGFLWSYQYYDWKGRATRLVPSDSSGSDGKDTLISYDGCGCAGGQITTVKGPVTTAVDVSGTTQSTKRRVQVAYADILGRTFKTEVHELDDPTGTPYATTKTTFNALDEPTLIRQYSGSDSSSTYQDTTFSYDGHGRLSQSHKPEQLGDYWSSRTYTSYTYNSDDSISTITDARGVVTTYSYGHVDDSSSSEYRKLLTKIAYTVPAGPGITDPHDVGYAYDAAGNRTGMTDGLGSVAYNYNSFSQMTDETRTFTDYIAYAPISGYGFKLQYTYTLAGGLKSLTDPYGKEIDYTRDKIGRISSVAGTTAVEGITTFLHNPSYRAWGALSHVEYGNGDYMNQTFDSRLVPTHFELRYSDNTTAMDKDFSYYNDHSPSYSQDHKNSHFDRLNKYDFAGRPVSAKTDEEARGNTQTTLSAMPYRQSYEYNAFSNMTQRNNMQWGDTADPVTSTSYNLSYTYSNNRITNAGFGYDADGRQTAGPGFAYYDAAGRDVNDGAGHSYDGDGLETKRETSNDIPNGSYTDTDTTTTYIVRSSVLGGRVITEHSTTEHIDGYTSDTSYTSRYKKYIYAGGSAIAYDIHALSAYSGYLDNVYFEHSDSSGMSYKTSYNNGTVASGSVALEGSPAELDGMGTNVGTFKPSSYETAHFPLHHINNDSPMAVDPAKPCPTVDYMEAPCSQGMFLLGTGAGTIYNGSPWVRAHYNGKDVLAFYHYYADGYAGYVPQNAVYEGGGNFDPFEAPARGRLRQLDTDFSVLNHTGDPEEDLAFKGTAGYWDNEFALNHRTPVDDDLLDKLRSILAQELESPECQDFINKYVGGANLLKVFDLARDQRGFAYSPNTKRDSADGEALSIVTGGLNDGGGVDFNPRLGRAQAALGGTDTKLFDVDLFARFANVLIHELIHISGDHRDDQDMKKLLQSNGEKMIIPDGSPGDPIRLAGINWDNILEQHCGVRPEVVKQWLGQ